MYAVLLIESQIKYVDIISLIEKIHYILYSLLC